MDVSKIEMKGILKKFNLQVIAFTSIVFVLVCWSATYFALRNYSAECRGTFGDMFGGINALFSGLAFCGIIITILLQSNELKLQRDEIKANRDELVRTTKVQQEQNVSLSRQAENLKISAKLSALNTLVSYYNENSQLAHKFGDNMDKRRFQIKAEKYVARIEEILERKEQL